VAKESKYTGASDEQTRLSLTIPNELNEKLQSALPWGTKSDVMRRLLELYIEASNHHGREFLVKLLDGKAKLDVTDGTNCSIS